VKAIEHLKALIVEEQEKIAEAREQEKSVTKFEKKIHQLRKMILYIETTPRYDFVASSLQTVENRISLIEAQFDMWKENLTSTYHSDTQAKAAYYLEMGRSELLQQQKFLSKILSLLDAV
jgi:hypothetical protein